MSVVYRSAARPGRRCAVVLAVFSLTPVLVAAQQQQAPDSAAGDVTVMPAVRVSDTEEGGRTEGSGSYTMPEISIGKQPLSIRETPQSVSVITRTRLDDQNLSSIADALKYATGVNVQRFDGAGLFNNYYVRGYQVDAIQLDGLAFGNTGNVTEFDAAVYDHIEILKGPAGLFQGAGEPGASINLARKQALEHTQFGGALTAGSWDAYRAELDATGALTGDGRLRARGVAVIDDRESYQDVVRAKRQLVYGTAEYDLAPATTLSVGGTRQQIDSVINQGLPAYADGSLLDVPRSTFIGADWNLLTTDATDVFAELVRRMSGGGLLKFAARHLDREMLYKVARANGAVDEDGKVPLQTGLYRPDRENWSADAYASLPLKGFGRTHNLLFGVDYRRQRELVKSSPFVNTATINVYEPDHDVPQPDFVYTSRSSTEAEQVGAYGQLRYRLLDSLTLVGGGRFTWWDSSSKNLLTGATTADYDASGEFTPYAALIYDVLKQVSLYASYADIFMPQNATTSGGEQIEPRTGGQVEAGAKGEFLDGRVNTQLAVFRIQDQNRAIADPNDSLYSVAQGKVRSQGFETEISGQLLPTWDMTLGYTYVDTEYRKGASASQDGQTFATFTPRHSVSLWSQYLFHKGALDGLSVGGGVRTYSGFYSQSGAVRLVADSEMLVAARLGYRLDEHWSLNLVANNLFDEKYYEKVSSAGRQNFYGEPRSLNLSLRASF